MSEVKVAVGKVKAGGLQMPDSAAVDAARAERKAAGTFGSLPPGTVHGLPDGWVAAKIDPSLDEGRKVTLRAKWAAQGWIKLDGLQQVVGYPLGAEVWVKRAADFAADRSERDTKIAAAGKSGLMMLGFG